MTFQEFFDNSSKWNIDPDEFVPGSDHSLDNAEIEFAYKNGNKRWGMANDIIGLEHLQEMSKILAKMRENSVDEHS